MTQTSDALVPAPSGAVAAFENVDRALDEELNALQMILPGQASLAVVVEWVRARVRQHAGAVANIIGRRRREAAALAAAPPNESPQNLTARQRTFFQTVDPRQMVDEIGKGVPLEAIRLEYQATIAKVSASPVYGQMLMRYCVPEPIVRKLVLNAWQPVFVAAVALRDVAEEIKRHIGQLQSISASRGARAGIGMAAGIAGRMVGGRVGGIVTRLAVAHLFDTRRAVNDSMARVAAQFEAACEALTVAVDTSEKNLQVVFLALYAGNLRRLSADLAGLGRRIGAIDYAQGRLQVTLDGSDGAGFRAWAERERESITRWQGEGKWMDAANQADAALKFISVDPVRLIERVPGTETTYAVHFARAKCRAVCWAGDAAWNRGDILAAAQLYAQLLRSTPLAWGSPHCSGTPREESAAIAGWRLALAATTPVGERAKDATGTIVRYVRDAKARLADMPTALAAPDEHLDQRTKVASAVVAAFLAQRGGSLVPGSAKPSQEVLDVDEFFEDVEVWSRDVANSQAQDSLLAEWIQTKAEQRRQLRRRRRTFRVAGLTAGAGALFWVYAQVAGHVASRNELPPPAVAAEGSHAPSGSPTAASVSAKPVQALIADVADLVASPSNEGTRSSSHAAKARPARAAGGALRAASAPIGVSSGVRRAAAAAPQRSSCLRSCVESCNGSANCERSCAAKDCRTASAQMP